MDISSRQRYIAIGIIILVIIGIFVKLVFFSGRPSVPADFSEARLQGAAIAKNIVAISNNVYDDLAKISQFDQGGDTAQALIVISNQLIQNRQHQEEIIKLASQLEIMARNLENIRPASARQLATEAVGSEVALVSRLVGYNDLLKQLFEILQSIHLLFESNKLHRDLSYDP